MPTKPLTARILPHSWQIVRAETGLSSRSLHARFARMGITVEVIDPPDRLYALVCLDRPVSTWCRRQCHYCTKTIYPHDPPPPGARLICAACLCFAQIDPDLDDGSEPMNDTEQTDIQELMKALGHNPTSHQTTH